MDFLGIEYLDSWHCSSKWNQPAAQVDLYFSLTILCSFKLHKLRCAVHIGESIWFLDVLFQFLKTDAIRTGDTYHIFSKGFFSAPKSTKNISFTSIICTVESEIKVMVKLSLKVTCLCLQHAYGKQNALVIIFDSFSTYHKAKSLHFENKVTSKEQSLMWILCYQWNVSKLTDQPRLWYVNRFLCHVLCHLFLKVYFLPGYGSYAAAGHVDERWGWGPGL